MPAVVVISPEAKAKIGAAQPKRWAAARKASHPMPDTHLVYMTFRLCRSWLCQFLKKDLTTPLPRKLTLASAEEVRELVERAGAFPNPKSRQAFEQAISDGHGGLYLNLTDGQYARLNSKKRTRNEQGAQLAFRSRSDEKDGLTCPPSTDVPRVRGNTSNGVLEWHA